MRPLREHRRVAAHHVLDGNRQRVSANVRAPATIDFHRGRVFGQMAAFEPAANPAGILRSNMVALNWLAPYANLPVGQVSLAGSLGAIGTAKANAGYVVQFE